MRMLFTFIALMGTTATAMAQTPEVVAEVDSLLQKERQSVDVEVLRRLLNRELGFADKAEMQLPPHQWNPTAVMNPFLGSGTVNRPLVATLLPSHQLSQPIGPFDGTALPGGGIVYTLRIPAGADLTVDPKTNAVGLGNNCSQCHADVAHEGSPHRVVHKGQALALACSQCHEGGAFAKDLKEAAPKTAWERTKYEIAGEKIESLVNPHAKLKAERSPMCKPGDIAEQVIRVLAANAKNLGNLAKTERVTVVVTFDELPGRVKVASTASDKPQFTPDELQLLNLGVLHLKQLKFKESAEALERVWAKHQATVIRVAPGKLDEDFRNGVEAMTESIRGVHTQLAVTYANLGDLKKAKRALELATNFKIEIDSSETEKPRPKLPAKLIVSALKADIDAAKTPGDFRKAVTVERTGFLQAKR